MKNKATERAIKALKVRPWGYWVSETEGYERDEKEDVTKTLLQALQAEPQQVDVEVIIDKLTKSPAEPIEGIDEAISINNDVSRDLKWVGKTHDFFEKYSVTFEVCLENAAEAFAELTRGKDVG